MNSVVVEGKTDMPKKTHRKVLQLGWVSGGGMKGLEAVTETQGDTTNFYYQVTHKGKEVLQTVKHSEAQEHYDLLK